MASAESIYVPATEKFTLTLSKREAEVLLGVAQFIGGDPAGARGVIDGITEALVRAGVEHNPNAVKRGCNNSLYIK